MKYTPNTVKSYEFTKSIRGYDSEEVDTFLDEISNDIEELLFENEKLKKKVAELENQVAEYKKIEKNLQTTLLNAQESTTKSVESSKRQSALMIKEAEIKSQKMISNAKIEADEIRNSVVALREEKIQLIARLKAIVDTQEKLLNNSNLINKNLAKKAGVNENMTEIKVDDILEKLL